MPTIPLNEYATVAPQPGAPGWRTITVPLAMGELSPDLRRRVLAGLDEMAALHRCLAAQDLALEVAKRWEAIEQTGTVAAALSLATPRGNKFVQLHDPSGKVLVSLERDDDLHDDWVPDCAERLGWTPERLREWMSLARWLLLQLDRRIHQTLHSHLARAPWTLAQLQAPWEQLLGEGLQEEGRASVRARGLDTQMPGPDPTSGAAKPRV